jgi:hypothetical protein
MSTYEQKQWIRLVDHWEKKATPRQILPSKARAALTSASDGTRAAAAKAGRKVGEVTPPPVKNAAQTITNGALVSAVKGAVHLLEFATEVTAELMDPAFVLEHHRNAGREVNSLLDLRRLDLADLDTMTRRMAMKWRATGAVEGGALGVLAMVPYAGGAAAITLDIVVMQVLTTAIATRVAYAYGYDAADPDQWDMIERMVRRAYRDQTGKAVAMREAASGFRAGINRQRWSDKLRQDEKLMAAVEKLMKQFARTDHIPVRKVTLAMPLVSIAAGAGTNAYVLGDVAKQATYFGQTNFLADKYGLSLPGHFTA